MLALQHDKEGRVVAYVEYLIVDKDGSINDQGEYCYCKNAWVHKSVERGKLLKEFVMEEHMKWLQVKWLYFKRSKYNYRLRMYDIKKFYLKEK